MNLLSSTGELLDSAHSPEVAALLADWAPRAMRLLDEHGAFLAERRLRRYQSDLYDRGHFTLCDPRDGVARRCDATILHWVKAFAWRFPAPSGAFWVISSGPAEGYELDGLFLPAQGVFLLRQGRDPLIAVDFLRKIQPLEDETTPGAAAGVPSFLLLGHANFAHFLWNEMAALLELEERPNSGLSRILILNEPILPFAALFDWQAPIAAAAASGPALHNHAMGLHRGALFAAGAVWVTAVARQRVVERCRHALARPPAPRRPGHARLWLSLRLMYRHPVNQRETFALLLERLGRIGRPVEVLLDGYSLPQDLHAPRRYDVPLEIERAQAVMELARDLLRLVRGALGMPPVVDLTGGSLAEAIVQGETADFYICHHGTQQHKIGWLHAVPGLIHANAPLSAGPPAGWIADQCEGAPLPLYLGAQHIASAAQENERPGQPYFADYRFADPAAAAAAMAAEAARILALA